MSDAARSNGRREDATTLRADVSTVDPEDRSVEIIWSTGARVVRTDWAGSYVEELDMSPSAIRLERMRSGVMSLIDSHSARSMDNRIGTVLPNSVRVAGGRASARVKLSRNQRGETLFQDLQDGHPFAVSVGYRIHKFEETKPKDGSLPILRAIDWEPLELSAVIVPADPASFTRFEERNSMPSIAENADDSNEAPPVAPAPPVTPPARAFGAAERRAIAERYDLGEDFVRAHARTGESAFRAAAQDAIAARQEQTEIFPIIETRGMQDEVGTRATAMADGILARLRPGHTVGAAGRQFAGLSFPELCRESCRASGVRIIGLHGGAVVDAALRQRGLHGTSDFAYALGLAVESELTRQYPSLTAPIRRAFRRESASNFKAISRLSVGDFPPLLAVGEHGEFKRGTIAEGAESYRLATYGRVFGVTRQALVNDDLGALQRIMNTAPRAAADLESDLLVQLVESNANLADGKGIFHADHGNVGAAAPLSIESLSEARLAMRRQRTIDGRLIGAAPKYLVVPAELETLAETILAAVAATKIADQNPFSGKLELIVEPRLTDPLAWYIVADPDATPGAEYALLAGQEQPFTESRSGFDIDGVEMKVRHDFGAGFVDYRGWYRNPGAPPAP